MRITFEAFLIQKLLITSVFFPLLEIFARDKIDLPNETFFFIVLEVLVSFVSIPNVIFVKKEKNKKLSATFTSV